MRKITGILIAASVFLCGCEKEITLDYHTVDPIPVIEAKVSNDIIEAYISYTSDVTDNSPVRRESGALVSVRGSDGYFSVLDFIPSDGRYSAEGDSGEPGVTYTFEAEFGGNTYSAVSTMSEAVPIDTVFYRKEKMLSEELLFCCIKFTDTPGVSNYYSYYMFVNGKRYDWGVLSDDNLDGKQISLLVECSREHERGDEDRAAIKPGDNVWIELRSIDQFAFRYLTAVRVSDLLSPSNPPLGYTGNYCLGYFSAYSQFVYEGVYTEEGL